MGRFLTAVMILLTVTSAGVPAEEYFPSREDKQAPLDELLSYAQSEDLEAFSKALTMGGADPMVTDAERRHALHYAAYQGCITMIELLLNHGADPAEPDENGMLPVHAAYPDYPDAARALSKGGELLFAPDPQGNSVIEKAVAEGRSAAEALLGRRLVNARSPEGNTVMHYAAAAGEREVITWLIDSQAQVNPQNHEGLYPLDTAFSFTDSAGHVLTARLLIEAHALAPSLPEFQYAYRFLKSEDAPPRDDHRNSVLHIAASRDHAAILSYAVQQGLSLEKSNDEYRTPLHSAAEAGKLRSAEILLSEGSNPNAADSRGYTPLYVSVSQGHIPLVSLLLDRGADANASDLSRKTPVHHAAESHDPEILKLLLDAGGNQELTDNEGKTPLMCALDRKAWECARVLLENQADIFTKDNEGVSSAVRMITSDHDILNWDALDPYRKKTDRLGNTLLHIAAGEQISSDKMTLLIEQGTPADAANAFGETPVHIAVGSQHMDAASVCLEHGADLHRKSELGLSPLELIFQKGRQTADQLISDEIIHSSGPRGETPLLTAVGNAHPEIVSLLIERGADIHAGNAKGVSPLHKAAAGNSIPILQQLIRAGANFENRDDRGNTALHTAVYEQSNRAGRLLLLSGAIPDIRNASGDTPMHISVKQQNSLAVRMLAEFNASLEIRDDAGLTPLLLASLQQLSREAELLISLGADIHARDLQGNTALHLAVRNRDELIVRALMEHGADIHSKNRHEESSLTLAFEPPAQPLSWIMDYGMIMERDNHGNTPLHLAIREYASLSILRELIELGSDIDTRNNYLQTPLHIALEHPFRKAVMLLRDAGADVFIEDSNGISPFDMALEGGLEIFRWLIDEGNIHQQDNRDQTPLHHAVKKNKPAFTEYLLEQGADPGMPDADGITPLDTAEAEGFDRLLEILSGKYQDPAPDQ